MSHNSVDEWGGGAAEGDPELPGGISGDDPRDSESGGAGVSTDLPGDGNQGAVSNEKYPPPLIQGDQP